MTGAHELDRMIASQPGAFEALKSNSHSCAAAAEILVRCRRITLAGTGTSSHAAIVGEQLLWLSGVDAAASTNFDFVTYPRPITSYDGLIALSHTGRTQYGRRAIQRARTSGMPVIGITGIGSEMEACTVTISTCSRERSDTYTVSYTTSLLALALIAVEIGSRRGIDMQALHDALAGLPDAARWVLRESLPAVESVAPALAARGRLLLAGAGPNFATAREGALKVKESSFLSAEGFELETLLHGGLQAVEAGDIAVVIAAQGPGLDRTLDAVRALTCISSRVVLIADERIAASTDLGAEVTHITYPAVPEAVSPLLAVLPLQVLAARVAMLRGTNPDNFRFDDPPYREAIGSLVL